MSFSWYRTIIKRNVDFSWVTFFAYSLIIFLQYLTWINTCDMIFDFISQQPLFTLVWRSLFKQKYIDHIKSIWTLVRNIDRNFLDVVASGLFMPSYERNDICINFIAGGVETAIMKPVRLYTIKQLLVFLSLAMFWSHRIRWNLSKIKDVRK